MNTFVISFSAWKLFCPLVPRLDCKYQHFPKRSKTKNGGGGADKKNASKRLYIFEKNMPRKMGGGRPKCRTTEHFCRMGKFSPFFPVNYS